MSENRKFYEILRKDNMFSVLKQNTVIFSIQCEELIQCDTVLVAKQPNNLYIIYMPVLVGSNHWDFKKGFICILENVKEFYYHNKPQNKFNSGFLLLNVETGNSCGYWTTIDVEFFECCLTPERAKSRCASLFKIPYTGISEGTFMDKFDYLSLDNYLINIDSTVHLVNNLGGSIYSSSAKMFLKTLGKVQVNPLPFKDYFEVISEEGTSFYTTDYDKGYKDVFGPFFNIETIEFEYVRQNSQHLVCYLAKNQNNEIIGMFYEKLNTNPTIMNTQIFKVLFSSPVEELNLVEVIETSNGSIAIWKVSYVCGNPEILFSSISNNNSFEFTLDLSKYI